MPKLTQEQIAAAKAQGYGNRSGGSDEPLKPLPVEQGQAYVYKLVACTSGPAKSNPSRIQWTWEFQLDGRYHPDLVNAGYMEKIWHYTPVDQEWMIAKILTAFGYSLETDTDELINDEATVLIYPVVEVYRDTRTNQDKQKMKARRFAYHDEEEHPKKVGAEEKPPMLVQAEEELAAYQAGQGAASAAAPGSPQEAAPWGGAPAATGPVAMVKPEPQDDPWAAAESAGPVVPPHPTVDEDDEF